MSLEGLIKKLREKAGYFDYDGRPDIACDYEQAADAIEKLQARVKENDDWWAMAKALADMVALQWIPVTERLPEDFKAVLVYTPKFLNQFMAYHKDDGWRVWSPQDNHGVPFINGQGEITHWMPLPEPPTEET